MMRVMQCFLFYFTLYNFSVSCILIKKKSCQFLDLVPDSEKCTHVKYKKYSIVTVIRHHD